MNYRLLKLLLALSMAMNSGFFLYVYFTYADTVVSLLLLVLSALSVIIYIILCVSKRNSDMEISLINKLPECKVEAEAPKISYTIREDDLTEYEKYEVERFKNSQGNYRT